jgi:multidrug efflux system outer membrane protein
MSTIPAPAGARALALAAALAMAGCASLAPPNAALPDVGQPQWRQADAATPAGTAPTDLAQWWQRFGDAELSALVAQSLQAHTSVRSAQAALLQSRALARAAAAQLLPSVTLGGSAQRSDSMSTNASNRFGAAIDAGWEPDFGGGLGASRDAAQADAVAASYTLADAQVSLAAEVALAYLERLSAQARAAIAERNLATQQDSLQIARWRQQAGLVSTLDVEQAEAAVAQTRAQLPTLASAAAQAAHRLAVLTGRPPADATLPSAATPVPLPADDLVLAFPADTLRQRPDVRVAETRVLAARSRVAAADAERLPSLRLGGSIGLSALTLGGLTGGGALAQSLIAAVSLPIFDGGAIRARVDAQSAAWEQARIGYEAAVLAALEEVENALVALRASRERLGHLQRAAAAARSADQLARAQYEAGLADFRTVLDAQRTLLGAEDGVQTQSATLAADHVRLYKALGGGWSPAATATTTTTTITTAGSGAR